MNIVLDASVIVAAHVESDNLHGPAFEWMNEPLGRDIIFLGAHTLAETYAALTKQRVPAMAAEAIVADLVGLVGPKHVVALDGQDYLQAVQRVARSGYTSGIIYDALLTAAAAEKVGATHIVTLNRRHFELIWAPGNLIVPGRPLA